MGQELSAATTERDGLVTAIKGFTTENQNVPSFAPRRFGMPEFVLLFAPTILGYVIARYMNVEVMYGVFGGLFAGAYLINRRMG